MFIPQFAVQLTDIKLQEISNHSYVPECCAVLCEKKKKKGGGVNQE